MVAADFLQDPRVFVSPSREGVGTRRDVSAVHPSLRPGQKIWPLCRSSALAVQWGVLRIKPDRNFSPKAEVVSSNLAGRASESIG